MLAEAELKKFVANKMFLELSRHVLAMCVAAMLALAGFNGWHMLWQYCFAKKLKENCHGTCLRQD